MAEESRNVEVLKVNFSYKRKQKYDLTSEYSDCKLQVKDGHFKQIVSAILEEQTRNQDDGSTEQMSSETYRRDTLQRLDMKLQANGFNKPGGEQQEDNSRKLPGIVLAVVGDSESFVPKPWNTTAFTSGLLETVKGAKQSWIIYRGKKDGISELIHRAFKDDIGEIHKDWKASLIALKPKTQGSSYKQRDEFLFHLEPKFDGNKEDHKEYKWYNKYLTQFLSHLSKQFTTLLSKKAHNNELIDLLKMRVPVLLVVAEGDVGTIHQVKSAVTNNVPVLLVKGSGKASNFIADYLKEPIPSERERMLIEKAPLLLGIYIRRTVLEKLKKTMNRISQYHYLVTVFDIDNTDGDKMEDAVVEAIIKGWSLQEVNDKGPNEEVSPPHDAPPKSRKRQVERTITSNVVNLTGEIKSLMENFQFTLTPGSLSLYFYMAYQYIQENITDNKETDLQLLLLEALIANRVDYVSAMLQSGIQFNPAHRERLYTETLKCKNCSGKDCRNIHSIHIRVLKKSGRRIWCTCRPDCKMEKCLNKRGSIQEPATTCYPIQFCNCCEPSSLNRTYPGEPMKTESCICIRHHSERTLLNSFTEAKYLCQELLNYPNLVVATKKKDKKEDSIKKTLQTDPEFQNLLAWALFANRRDLAGVFWARCSNQLLTAVMASSILQNMAENVESAKDRHLHEELLQHSKIFEERVLELQTTLYEEKENECMSLMMSEDNIWGIEVSPVACAYDNKLMDVIGHPCVQRKLNKIWYNDSAVKWTEWMKSMFGCHGINNLQKAWKAPIAMFAFHYMLVLVVLFVFSSFLLTDLRLISNIKGVGIYEWLLYVWLLGDVVEEVLRNIVLAYKNKQRGHLSYRLKNYISNFWSWMTVLSYLSIGCGIVMRALNAVDNVRILYNLYSLGLFLMYMRFLQSMLVVHYFGPKIMMILKMLRELVNIGWILLVFIACTGVLYHANMYPSHFDMWSLHGPTYWRIWKIVALPYWQIYGELSLDEIQGKNSEAPCTSIRKEWETDKDIERCVEYDWSLSVIAAFYMLITNLLLVNLVIALFTYRFEEVQRNSDRLWKYNRYTIITDFMNRFPVPFNLLIRPPHLIYSCAKKIEKKDDKLDKLQSLHAAKCLYKHMTMNKNRL